jgi:hypothetical protein
MSRLAPLSFLAILAVAALIAYRVAEPQRLVAEAENADVQLTIAVGVAAMASALTPTATAYASPTPTRTPKPATNTPEATFGSESSPGIYIVPAWTPTPANKGTVEPEVLPPCVNVTPDKYSDTYCEVGQ